MKEAPSKQESTALATVPKADIALAQAITREEAEIKAAYTMAIMRPRDFDLVRSRVLKACKRASFAANKSAYYRKPVGKDKQGHQQYVQGAGIRLAEELARQYGNLRCQIIILRDDDEAVEYSVTVLDLETNTSWPQVTRVAKKIERKKPREGQEIIGQRKNSYGEIVYIVRPTDEELLMLANSHLSRALRNAIIRAVPNDLTEDAIEQIVETRQQEGGKKTPEEKRKEIFDAFSERGIDPPEVEAYVQRQYRKKMVELTERELVELRAVYGALLTGEATWADFTEAAEAQDEKAKGSLSPDDLKVKAADPNEPPGGAPAKQKEQPEAERAPEQPVAPQPAPQEAPTPPTVPQEEKKPRGRPKGSKGKESAPEAAPTAPEEEPKPEDDPFRVAPEPERAPEAPLEKAPEAPPDFEFTPIAEPDQQIKGQWVQAATCKDGEKTHTIWLNKLDDGAVGCDCSDKGRDGKCIHVDAFRAKFDKED